MVDTSSAAMKSGVSTSRSARCRSAQEYRDLLKLIPAVQVTQDTVRGPSAGGSGQDNVYQFDGVNVTLPLFGTLASEPASHDIEQVTTVRGGARAVDFDRSGGFTDRLGQQVGHEPLQRDGPVPVPERPACRPDLSGPTVSRYRAGPVAGHGERRRTDRLRTSCSSSAPTSVRTARARLQSNAYGDLPDFEYERNEGFGKVTFTPVRQRPHQCQLP